MRCLLACRSCRVYVEYSHGLSRALVGDGCVYDGGSHLWPGVDGSGC